MARRNARPDPSQFALDFQSKEDERRYLLRACRFQPGTRYLKVRFLLELIANEGQDGEIAWTRADLAARMSISQSGVVDTINDACFLGVLSSDDQWRRDGSRAPNRLSIQWTGLVTFLPGRSDDSVTLPPSRQHGGDEVRTRGEPPRHRTESQSATRGSQSATRGSQFAPPPSQSAAPLRKHFSSSSQEGTLSPSSPCSWEKGEGEQILGRLSGIGMACARRAVDIAQRHGLSASDVHALIDHFEQIRRQFPSYSVGALYGAIEHAIAGQAPEQFFVGVPEGLRRQASEVDARAARDEQARTFAAHRAQAEAEAREREQLEAEYGPRLDALPKHERDELVAEVLAESFAKDTYRRNPRSMVVREPLLLALRERDAVNHGGQG